MKPMVFWNVYLNGKEIDSVPYTPDCDKDYVLRSLIDHDGYDPAITVRRAPGQTARSKRSSPNTVYSLGGGNRCPIKIVRRGEVYSVYHCKEIQLWPSRSSPTYLNFLWESSARERWNSQPYGFNALEKGDVVADPKDLWPHLAGSSMCYHLMHILVNPPGGRTRAAPEDDYDYRRSARCTCAKK